MGVVRFTPWQPMDQFLFRTEPRQKKITLGWMGVHFSKRYQPLAEDHDKLRNSRLFQLARPTMIKADLEAYCLSHETEQHDTKAFIEFHNFRAIGYYKDIMGLPGAVQPWIPDGMSNHTPAFGGFQADWALWYTVADPDRPGQPLAEDAFERNWVLANVTPTNDPKKNVFHHIVKNHEGELRSMDKGEWVKMQGVPPDVLFHPQYATDSSQFWLMLRLLRYYHW